ncbi:hypothetical protein ACO3VM_00225 [Methanocaldococcus sp. 10A]
MTIIFDLNGTIAADGVIKDSTKEKIKELCKNHQIFILSADTFVTLKDIERELGVKGIKINKEKFNGEKIAKNKILKRLEKNTKMKKSSPLGIGQMTNYC